MVDNEASSSNNNSAENASMLLLSGGEGYVDFRIGTKNSQSTFYLIIILKQCTDCFSWLKFIMFLQLPCIISIISNHFESVRCINCNIIAHIPFVLLHLCLFSQNLNFKSNCFISAHPIFYYISGDYIDYIYILLNFV